MITLKCVVFMFRVGQKVICIDDRVMLARMHEIRDRNVQFPEEGKMYTVRDVLVRSYGTGIYLEEIKNPEQQFGFEFCEPGFLVERFRPISPVEEAQLILAESAIEVPG